MKRMNGFFRTLIAVLLACALALPCAFAENADGTPREMDQYIYIVNQDAEQLSREETLKMVQEVKEAYYKNDAVGIELQSDIKFTQEEYEDTEGAKIKFPVLNVTVGDSTMRCIAQEIGEADEDGTWPLYIALHGGGGGPSEGNDSQWLMMAEYYSDSIGDGVYIACRGITDTWDLHFQPETYPLLDRLIEAMIYLYHVDPNQVYLLGFSAGGDGVYQLAPRLADRFAAVNMSSGHPNGVSLLNLANCPICLQVGVRDFYTDTALRSVRAAEFEKTLSEARDKYGFGYTHKVFVHVPEGHNFNDYESNLSTVLKDPAAYAEAANLPGFLDLFLDASVKCGMSDNIMELSYDPAGLDEAYDAAVTKIVTETLGLETETADTGAVAYVSQFTRDPAPAQLVWDLSTRAEKRQKNSFYWLSAAPEVNKGVITASYDAETNTITVGTDGEVNGDFDILFHPALVDVSRTVTIKTGNITREVWVNPSEEFLKASILETGDPELACVGKISYSLLVNPEKNVMTIGDLRALIASIQVDMIESLIDVDLTTAREKNGGNISLVGNLYALFQRTLKDMAQLGSEEGHSSKVEAMEGILDAFYGIDAENPKAEEEIEAAFAGMLTKMSEGIDTVEEVEKTDDFRVISFQVRAVLDTLLENQTIMDAAEATGSKMIDMITDFAAQLQDNAKEDGTIELRFSSEDPFAAFSAEVDKVSNAVLALDGPKQGALDMLNLVYKIMDNVRDSIAE